MLKKVLIFISALFSMIIPSTISLIFLNEILDDNVVYYCETSPMKSKINNEKKTSLDLWMPWDFNKRQSQAMISIVDQWNVDHPEEIINIIDMSESGGYSGISEQIQLDLETGQIDKLPDIYIGYSDITSNLLAYSDESYALELTSQPSTSDIKDNIVDSLEYTNNNIQGGVDGMIYTIPFNVSSEMMGINSKLLIWALQQFVNQGGDVNIDGDIMRQVVDSSDGLRDGTINNDKSQVVYEQYVDGAVNTIDITKENFVSDLSFEANDPDIKDIEENWKVTNNDLSGEVINIDDKTFEDWNSIQDLSEKIILAIEPTKDKLSSLPDQAIYGHDAPNNIFYSMAQSILDTVNNPDDSLIKIDDLDNDGIKEDLKYEFLNLSTSSNGIIYGTSPQVVTVLEIYDYFIDGFNSGVLWVPNAESLYGSDSFKEHKMFFSNSSTAGGAYLFGPSDPDTGDGSDLVNAGELVYVQSPGKFKQDSKVSVQMQQGPQIGGVDKGDETKNRIISDFFDYLVDGTYKKDDWTIKNGDYEEVIDGVMTPSEFMSVYSNYIVGAEHVFNDDGAFINSIEDNVQSNGKWEGDNWIGNDGYDEVNYSNKYIIGPSIAFDNIMEVKNDSSNELQMSSEVTGVTTRAVRDNFKTTLSEEKQNVIDGREPSSAIDWLIKFHNDSIKNGWNDTGEILNVNSSNIPLWSIILMSIMGITIIILIIILIIYWIDRRRNLIFK